MSAYVKIDNDNELTHYGVKGMKWGVRRDTELLANRRRNVAVRKAKQDYKDGRITEQQKKQKIASANAYKKDFLKKTKTEFESASKSKQEKMSMDLKKQAANEVPNRTIHKGVDIVNKAITGYNIGSLAVSAASAAVFTPAAAPILAATFAGYTVGQVGRYLAIKAINDRRV